MRRCRTCAKQTSDVHGRIGSMSWTRRDLLKTSAALGLAVPTAGYPFGLSAQEAAAPKMGGRAVVAMNAATETIDPHFSRRSEEHTSELQSLMRISYAVFCLKKKRQSIHNISQQTY